MLYYIASLITIILVHIEMPTYMIVILTSITTGLATIQYWSDFRRNSLTERHVGMLCDLHERELDEMVEREKQI